MKKIKKGLFFLTIFLAISCQENFLDTNPYNAISSSNAWESEANAEMAINGIYNALNQHYTMMGYFFEFTNLGPDGFNWIRDEQIQRGTATSNHHLYLNTYTGFYRVIKYANDAITNLTDNPNIDQALAERMIGEAKFMRGLSYFYLLQLYGGVIILDEPVAPSETYLPRNTAEEVRQFVIDDFRSAGEVLPADYSDDQFGRATKGAAIMMLGKTYLYNEQWAQAAEQFEQLLGGEFSYGLVDNYGDLFDHFDENNEEIVFSMQAVMQPGQGSSYDDWYGGRDIYANGESRSQATYDAVFSYTHKDGTPIDPSSMPDRADFSDEDEFEYGLELIDWYQTTFADADERVHANVIVPGYTIIGRDNVEFIVHWPYAPHANDPIPAYRFTFSNEAFYSWRKMVVEGNANTLGRHDGPVDVPVMRFADVLLMYAEAKNEAEGPSSEVYNAVNEIRGRAGVVDVQSGLTQDQMRRTIREERMKEFAGEGHLFFDVRRWRLAHTQDPLFGLNDEILDFRGLPTDYVTVFTEEDYLWPIPQQELDLNPNLEQNPGW